MFEKRKIYNFTTNCFDGTPTQWKLQVFVRFSCVEPVFDLFGSHQYAVENKSQKLAILSPGANGSIRMEMEVVEERVEDAPDK